MPEGIQAPQDASPAAQEILKELAGEGHEVEGITPKEEPKVEEPKEPKAEEPKTEPEPEDKSKAERTEKFVPVGKHNEERHKRQEAERAAQEATAKWKELEEQLAKVSNKPQANDVETKAKRIAEKHGIDEEFAKDLISEVLPNQSLPPELAEDLKAIKQYKAEQEKLVAEQKQEAFFNNEFASVIKEFPDLADQKEVFKQLAFSEGNINTSLRRLALEYLHDNPVMKGRKTAEAPVKSGRDTEPVIDFAEMTDEDFKKLTYEQMEQYEQYRKKNNIK